MPRRWRRVAWTMCLGVVAGVAAAAVLAAGEAAPPSEQAKLTASDAATGDLFGVSVALSGNTAVVGAAEKTPSHGAGYAFTGIPNPGIALASPATLSVGTPIDVSGAGFGAKPKAWLDVGGKKVALKVATTVPGTHFTATAASIPHGVNGACTLNVLPAGSKTPLQYPGMTIASPVIDKIGPASGAIGDLTTILGSGFGSKKGRVTLDGVACRVLVWTDRWVEIVVPAKLTAGPADVVVDAGTASALAAGAFTVK